ncbi:MAG: aminomethyl-transferring glycine dehydrogenase subunit GcvPA [Candidatus Cloacimonetes bacterium]|nr:aminomethyl-transferring glycine dehydrogenase subunit GcvPA [Candidatus Cloacimonadota bacterium]
MPFISNTDQERREMLAAIGVKDFADLLVNIPPKFLHQELCCLENSYSELEISRRIDELASRNISTGRMNSFLGGGIYDHFIPAAVDHIIHRPEFHSAYTPYQAEVSQGTLQYIYEYQSMICELTGMDISNAGMYDGATATAEAILMAVRKTGKKKALLAATLNPAYLRVIKAYTEGVEIELIIIPESEGIVDLDKLKNLLDKDTACAVIQTPSFLGNIEQVMAIEKIIHENPQTLLITCVDPISLALLNSPAEYNCDIVVGEGQALGNFQAYGGPLFGFLATRMDLARTMPGRIVGATVDVDGKKAYALTLQAREQHIRRAKATSNICSNQALCNLAATVYLSLLGPKGLKEIAVQSTTKAHYLAEKIAALPGYELAFPAPFFKEFAVKTRLPVNKIISQLKQKNIFPGIDLTPLGKEQMLLIAVTEKKRKRDLDELVNALQEVNNG